MSEPVRSADSPLRSLPLATLYLTERCNSRCVSCDYWRHGRKDMDLATVKKLLPELSALRTQVILLSGGEPLLHPEWREIAAALKSQGLQLWLLTSGLSLAKHAVAARELFESITVSLDGACAETYRAIRGLDAFHKVCEGIEAAALLGSAVSVRVTVQRANYAELPALVALSRRLGARRVSFLAADVSNPHAFGRDPANGFANGIALREEDLVQFAAVLARMECEQAGDFASGFIAESPQKLARILAYYEAISHRGPFPDVRCNAPEFSAVIEAGGQVRPCFFIPGPDEARAQQGLIPALNGLGMLKLRSEIRARQHAQCERCVCSMWRDLTPLGDVAL